MSSGRREHIADCYACGTSADKIVLAKLHQTGSFSGGFSLLSFSWGSSSLWGYQLFVAVSGIECPIDSVSLRRIRQ